MARAPQLLATMLLGLCAVAFAAGPADIWLDVPFVKQTDNGCGPASVAMVVQYWQSKPGGSTRVTSSVTEIERALQPDAKQGVRASAMQQYFTRNGYRAVAFAGVWADLERELEQGRPLIAALKPPGDNQLHYVVVAGVDDGSRVVLLNDPAQRKLLKEDRAQFEREWKATQFWTLLAVPAVAAP